MSGLLLALTGIALVARLALARHGLTPALPWVFALQLAVLFPFALVWARALTNIPCRLWTVALVVISAFVSAWVSWGWLVWGLLVSAVLWRPQWPPRAFWVGLGILLSGYAGVWSLNYLVLWHVRGRLLDPIMRAWDQATYHAVFGHPVDYTGFFPLVPDALADLFSVAYLWTFPEMVLILALRAHDARWLTGWLTRVFTCYGIGIALFWLWPVGGPFLAEPSAIRPLSVPVLGYMMQAGRQAEFNAVVQGHPLGSAFGYFMALPSLHAALAVLAQHALRPWPLAYWGLLPVNVLMAAATFVLGFHYLVDTVAGVALGLLAIWAPRLELPAISPDPRGLPVSVSRGEDRA